ncbi:MAG: DUF4976 domain-containing protein [Planctomycetes bacterium]|nr:DUF4976 domain-containing protein [Planctomycetota bacterium]
MIPAFAFNLVSLLILVACCGCAHEAQPLPRPNIVFILADDHGAQALSAYDTPQRRSSLRTPGIDRLATEGMRFDRFCVENAICAPSRAAFLTGCMSMRHGVVDNSKSFDATQPTWPSLLRSAGYTTALKGKWHLKSRPEGFDDFEALIDQGEYWNPRFVTAQGTVRREGYCTDIITERAVEFLAAQAGSEKPFALVVHHKAPHRNWMPPPRHYWMFANETLPEPATLFDTFAGRGRASTLQTMSVATHLTPNDLKLVPPQGLTTAQLDAWTVAHEGRAAEADAARAAGPDAWRRFAFQTYAKDYLRCVAAVDESVQRLLGELDRLGLAKNTIVIYSSDQGWFLGEHGWYDKRWMYEESLRTPFLLRWPGKVPAGSSSAALCQNTDLAPTLLAAAGVPVPERMEGRNLAPLFASESAAWRDALYYRYFEAGEPHQVPAHDGVRTARWKLINFHTLAGADAWELYDLEADPDELRDLSRDGASAAILNALRERLWQLRVTHGSTDLLR